MHLCMLLVIQPTNIQCIELQLMKRFTEDNAHMQLLATQPQCTSDASKELSYAVLNQALHWNTLQPVDEKTVLTTSGVQCITAKKYTLAVFPRVCHECCQGGVHTAVSSVKLWGA